MSEEPSQESTMNDMLSEYIIKQTIGTGTFSKVKLGIHKKTRKKVAIKILEKCKIVEKDDFERIVREMSMVTEFNHPNIVKVYEMYETDDNYLIIMEYCEGGELFNYIVEKRRLSEEETAYFFYQLINGIEYIHSKGVVHRDLKPENLLLDNDKVLKIIDFGLSNYFNGELLVTPCGSPCYASPEMVTGNRYNGFYIDVWSTGIILFAMLCGYLPFEDPNNEKLFKKIAACKLEYPSHLTKLSKDIMRRILVTDPEKRIKVKEIKKHDFYLLGKEIYERRFNKGKDSSEDVSPIYLKTEDNIACKNKAYSQRTSAPKTKYSNGSPMNKNNKINIKTKIISSLNTDLFQQINKKRAITLENERVERRRSNATTRNNQNFIGGHMGNNSVTDANLKNNIAHHKNYMDIAMQSYFSRKKPMPYKAPNTLRINTNILSQRGPIKKDNHHLFLNSFANQPVNQFNKRTKIENSNIYYNERTIETSRVPMITNINNHKLPNIKIKKNVFINCNFYPEYNAGINKPVRLKTDSNIDFDKFILKNDKTKPKTIKLSKLLGDTKVGKTNVNSKVIHGNYKTINVII
ncbi:MAG: serine/threonine-protein kinase [archaeon]|nr:serine/threonine-protein kinase [archaeon]